MLENIKPRKYQEEILETCKEKNCLVILPTGVGKTLVALMLTIHRMEKFPDKKVVFLAPTRPLANQHFLYFKSHLPELYATMELFTGKTKADKRQELWQNADIIFSTPQCIANDLRAGLYGLEDVSLLIEDECHRCMKNYDYTYLAEKYKEQGIHKRVLGLTASPGSEKAKIKQICSNLGIEAVEIRTRDSEDVKPYLQELKFELFKVDFPEEFVGIRALLKKIFDRRIDELKNRKLLFQPATKRYLLETQARIMKSITSGNKHFNLLLGASACAQALKVQHALELIETQTLASVQLYLQELFKQAASQKSKAVQNLVKQPEFNEAYIKVVSLIAQGKEHPKLIKLKELAEAEIGGKKKIMIFAQYRDTAVKIVKTLNEIAGANARVFVGQAKKGTGKEMTGLNQKEQQALVEEFASGEVNILVSTSIGEEGLDIPEVNAVIFYEPVPSEIRKIQRAGRTARLIKGKLIMMVTIGTRDEAYYWSAFNKEKKMYRAIAGLKGEIEKSLIEDKQESLDDI